MSFLGGLFNTIGDVVTGNITGAISEVGSAFTSRPSTPTPAAMPGGATVAVPPSYVKSSTSMITPDSGDGEATGNAGAAAAGPGGLVCQGKEALNPTPHTKAGKPRKWRQTKNGGCTWHKKPSVNAMNPHAARRAIHRITKARKLLMHIERALPSRHHARRAAGGRISETIRIAK